MKIDVETERNIGDIVWIAEWIGDDAGYRPDRARISGIDIKIYDKAVRNISYFIGDIVSYSDNELFATKAEAQAECDRLNKGDHVKYLEEILLEFRLNKGLMNSSEREDLELIRMMRMLSSDEQMEIYKSAFDKLPKDQKEHVLNDAEKLQSFRNMGILSSYELLFKLGVYHKWHVEAQI